MNETKFRENITNELKEKLGNFIPEDYLKEIVDKSLHDLFFHPHNAQSSASWFTTEVSFLLQPIVKDLILKEIENNKEFFLKSIEDTLKTETPKIISRFLIDLVTRNSWDVSSNIINNLHRKF